MRRDDNRNITGKSHIESHQVTSWRHRWGGHAQTAPDVVVRTLQCVFTLRHQVSRITPNPTDGNETTISELSPPKPQKHIPTSPRAWLGGRTFGDRNRLMMATTANSTREVSGLCWFCEATRRLCRCVIFILGSMVHKGRG